MTLCERLAVYFHEHANTWIDGRDLAKIAGSYAWRTRVSDLRKPPFNLRIENRVRTLASATAQKFTVSEYRFVPVDVNAVTQAPLELSE